MAKRYVSGHCSNGNHLQCNIAQCKCPNCAHAEYAPREVSTEERAALDHIKSELLAVRTVVRVPAGPARSDAPLATTPGGVTPSAMRAWLASNGYPALAGQRGRLPLEAMAVYQQAHGINVPARAKASVRQVERRPVTSGIPSSLIRQWAVANGFASLAGKRGRIPREAMAAFASA